MIYLKIILAIVILTALVYLFSRIATKGALAEIEEFLKDKAKKDDTKERQ